jgi:phosphatidylserine decarboxylase
MTIHKEGFKTIFFTALFLILTNSILFYYTHECCCLFSILFSLVSLGLWIFIISFFRIPNRPLTRDEHLIVSPCDGKVVVIEEVFDEEYFKEKRLQVSIFMSPANVHVNRNPISGEVVYSKYHPGKYLVAWNPKSSTENERHSIVIKKEAKEILVKQIAGAVARRIVKSGQTNDVVGFGIKAENIPGKVNFGKLVLLLHKSYNKNILAVNIII